MTRPLLLDLFCCEGGMAMGYHRAGFDVIGVDIEHQPRYPFKLNTLTPTLAALRAMEIPYVVENVPEAGDEMRTDYLLCGTQFGLNVRRHRIFERGNWDGYQLLPPCQCYRNRKLIPFEHKDERAFADAMGCDWMTARGGRQAIPPTYAEFIGGQLLAYLGVEVG